MKQPGGHKFVAGGFSCCIVDLSKINKIRPLQVIDLTFEGNRVNIKQIESSCRNFPKS